MNEINFKQLNEIANQVSITEYLSSIGIEPATKQGHNYYYYCNNSHENHASCCVDTSVNRYSCFSCHLDNGYGNLLTYLTKELHMSFSEACKRILDYANISPTELVVTEKSETVKFLESLKRDAEKKPREIKRTYGSYEEHNRLSKAPSQTWIKEGISAETQRLYDVRTCPERNQILYPIYDSHEKYLCDKFRLDLPKEVLDKLGLPKYRYTHSIGTTDFLTCMREAQESVGQSGEIIIVEGFKSVLHCHEFGINNVVAAETSCLNKAQVRLLLQIHPKSVVIAFDKDKQFAEVKSHLWILPRFTNVSIMIDKKDLLLPKMSPCDNGKEVFDQLYNERIRIN